MLHRISMLQPFLLTVAGCVLQVSSIAGLGLAHDASNDQAATPGTELISEIRFVGNKRTKPETMMREMLVKAGDLADPELIERSRQAIMDLDLFKSVQADLEPDINGHVLVIRVEEKHYFFVFPALSRSGDGDVSFGVRSRMDNLWGRDHRFDVELKRKNLTSDADVDNERTLEIDYRYPRMANGPWGLGTGIRYRKALLEEDRDGDRGDFERTTAQLELLVSRWKNPTGPSRGWRFGAGVSYEDFDFELIQGDPELFFDTTEVGILGRVDHRDVRVFEFNRSGHEFSAALEGFTDRLGSAKDRLRCFLRYRSYNPVTNRRHTNLNYQLRAAMQTESLFGDPTFSIGGGGSLRGYGREIVEGDAYILANVEFLTPISKLDALRGVVFADVGDAFRTPSDATLTDLKTSAGAGLRWKLRAFVGVDLRLDVARGFDEDRGGETKAYFGTDVTF